MKPVSDRLTLVTATVNPARAKACFASWERAAYRYPSVLVWNGALDTTGMSMQDKDLYTAWSPSVAAKYGELTVLERPEILGVVPAFALGVAQALADGAEIIACLHDDLLLEEDDWDLKVLKAFDAYPTMGLAGFGGGTGLGAADIYQVPYAPHQLAREGFVSNMREAEAHGRRSKKYERLAVLDGFSQIGRADFWNGVGPNADGKAPPLDLLTDWGLVHHAYDAALGAFAKRLGWEVRLVPVACHHFGGATAVGEPRYAEWAQTIVPGGDATFWELAHKEVYEQFRDVLPIRV